MYGYVYISISIYLFVYIYYIDILYIYINIFDRKGKKTFRGRASECSDYYNLEKAQLKIFLFFVCFCLCLILSTGIHCLLLTKSTG